MGGCCVGISILPVRLCDGDRCPTNYRISHVAASIAHVFIYITLWYINRHVNPHIMSVQAWVYEHFPFPRPRAQIGYIAGEPLARRWYSSSSSGNIMESIQLMHEKQDGIHPSKVNRHTYLIVTIILKSLLLIYYSVFYSQVD